MWATIIGLMFQPWMMVTNAAIWGTMLYFQYKGIKHQNQVHRHFNGKTENALDLEAQWEEYKENHKNDKPNNIDNPIEESGRDLMGASGGNGVGLPPGLEIADYTT